MPIVSGGDQPPKEDPIITNLRKEVQELQDAFNLLVGKIREMESANNEKIESLRNALHSANETINKYNRNLQFLEKRMDGMRNDTSTGLVVSVLVFAVLFIISLFIR